MAAHASGITAGGAPEALEVDQPRPRVVDQWQGSEGTVGSVRVGNDRVRQDGQRRLKEPGPGAVVSKIEADLIVAAQGLAFEKLSPDIQRIEGAGLTEKRRRVFLPTLCAQHSHQQVSGTEIVEVYPEGALQMVLRGGPVFPKRIDFAKGMEPRGLPGAVPGGFVERSVGLIQFRQEL